METDFRSILFKYWGYKTFRPLQEDIIQSVFGGRDTLGLMPTGGGKSITFQVPALARDGICIVVTPLIALMKDQVENLKKKGIKAIAVHSGLSKEETDIAFDNCIYGGYKFLYLSPERLTTDLFRVRVQSMPVNLLTIDEAHCISQWGYDFRPSYLQISQIRELLPKVPILALTATATPAVVDDIMDKLDFAEKNVFVKSFERKNLAYRVIKTDDKQGKLLSLVSSIGGTGIVYVRNRKKTREFAEFLQKNGQSADYYHAGLSYELRNTRQEEWQKGKIRIIVSTNAFGMGIDKPDVRLVVHMDLPDSPEAYYQEAGRAGRDEKESLACLLYNVTDKRQAAQRMAVSFPDLQTVRDVYHALGNYFQIPIGSGKGQSFDFFMNEFLSRFRFNALVAFNSLMILQREGYIELTDEINNPSRVHFKVHRDDLYKFQISNERYDGFIKLLLRSYTGFFSDFVAIDEFLLAKRSGHSRQDVYEYLSRLQGAGIITYIPQKRNPVIIFNEERLEKSNLWFQTERYNFLKSGFKERLSRMLEYASTDSYCRSRFLLEYFGEGETRDCGKCDVCRAKSEAGLSSHEFDEIYRELQKFSTKPSFSLLEIRNINTHSEEKVIKVFRWLLDKGKIRLKPDSFYEWPTE